MVRHIPTIGLIVLVLCAPALAQEFPRYEAFAGYGYVRPPGGQANLNGFHVSIAANMNEWLGVAAELGGQYGTQTLTATTANGSVISAKLNTHFNSLGFGPRFTYRRNENVTPFAHVLFGLARGQWIGQAPFAGDETSFATAIGGGFDTRLSQRIRLRIIQAEHVRTHFGSTAENNFRLATGVLFAF